MTFLPIVERELRVVARLRATYWYRVIIAGAVIGVAMIMLAVAAMSRTPFSVGHAMFWTLTYMALAFCLFEGVRKTADCLSEEKREGTLGLLFLTDLKGYDIILGKLTAKSLNSVYGLISVLPVLALSLLLGGTTSGEYWRVVLALLNVLFFSLCAGIWVSCWCREDRQAMTGTFLLVAVSMAAPLFAPMSAVFPLSPLYAIHMAGDGPHLLAPGRYWETLAIAQALSWAMLGWASLAVPNCWREEKVRAASEKWRWPDPKAQPEAVKHRAVSRAKMLEINPVLWLAGRDYTFRTPWWVLIMLGGIGVAGFLIPDVKSTFLVYYLIGCWIINFGIKMRVAARACHCLAEARRNNSLEMLLVTPLSHEQIVAGQFIALKRTFLKPISYVLALEMTGLLTGLSLHAAQQGYEGYEGLMVWGWLVTCFLALGYLGLFVLDFYAVAWTGMWHGLTCKRESQAVTRTILLVLVLPIACTFLLCGYGAPLGLILPIIFMTNARARLRHEVRIQATQPYQAPTQAAWPTGVVSTQPSPTQNPT